MDLLSQVYHRTLAENQRNISFWEDYLRSLRNLDFSIFSAKLKVPSLVPIGSRILFRGALKHTNEVTIALGADYFVKCSLQQAEVIRQHRIKGAQAKLDEFIKEKDYLENQMSFTKQNVQETQGHEIIEHVSLDEDAAWRVKHRENVRQYMQNRSKEDTTKHDNISDEDLFNRLEELELQEELEDEMIEIAEIKERNKLFQSNDSFIVKEGTHKIIRNEKLYPSQEREESFIVKDVVHKKDNVDEKQIKENSKVNEPKKVKFAEDVKESKLDLLQKVIDRQNELEGRLIELKNKDRTQSKTEEELMSRLDELEQLDDLEDEMDRLDDIIINEDGEDSDDDVPERTPSKLDRRVSFIDEDNSDTQEITFKHSPVEPRTDAYDTTKGITKPSDLYEAYSKSFGTTSILKKSKYGPDIKRPEVTNINKTDDAIDISKCVLDEDSYKEKETIVIKDVIEQVSHTNTLESKARPTSLFKKKRLQNKS